MQISYKERKKKHKNNEENVKHQSTEKLGKYLVPRRKSTYCTIDTRLSQCGIFVEWIVLLLLFFIFLATFEWTKIAHLFLHCLCCTFALFSILIIIIINVVLRFTLFYGNTHAHKHMYKHLVPLYVQLGNHKAIGL